MYHAADHTMSNVMANMGLWDEEFLRIDKARQSKGISDQEYSSMRRKARHAKTSFLKTLAGMVDAR